MPWTGTTLTNAPYRARYLPDGARVTAQTTTMIELLGNGNLQSLAGLTGAADKGIMFTGAGTAGTFDLPQRGRDLLSGISPVGMSVAVAANQADARFAIGAFSTSGGTVGGNMTVTGEIRSVFVTEISAPNGFRSRVYGEDVSGGRGPSTILNPIAGEFGQAFFVFTYQGNAFIPGAITAGSKSFQIDHPKDPYNKDLVFMSTEAPKAGVEDWGQARLINGEIEVVLDIAGCLSPGTFEALTQRAIVVSVNNLDGDTPVRAGRIVDGKFKIYAVDNPVCDDEVTWLVKAERDDPFIKSHPFCDPETGRLIPEQEKED